MSSNDNQSNAPVVLITGAAKRIGRCIAITMAQQGWDVAIHFHSSKEKAQELAQEIHALGRRAVCVGANLLDQDSVKNLVPLALAGLGRVQCVVNNASLFDEDNLPDFTYAALDSHMHVNLGAPVLLAQSLFEATRPDQQACVVNILDQKIFNLNPDFFSYTLSKAALQTATTTLAQALAPRVRVVGVAPGTTLASIHQDDSNFGKSHKIAALGQSSTPEDIANAVAYLASARAVTGTILAVDGGQHLIPLARDVMYVV